MQLKNSTMVQNLFYALSLVTVSRFIQKIGESIGVILRINTDVTQLVFVILSASFLLTDGFDFRGFWKLSNKKATMISLGCALPGYILRFIEVPNLNIPTSIFITIVCQALIEEIQFRGLVCSLGMKRASKRSSIIRLVINSGIIFGLFHFNNILAGQTLSLTIIQVIQTMAVGILFSFVYIYCESIWPTFIIHVANNLSVYAEYQEMMPNSITSRNIWLEICIEIILLINSVLIVNIVLNKKKVRIVLTSWKVKWNCA